MYTFISFFIDTISIPRNKNDLWFEVQNGLHLHFIFSIFLTYFFAFYNTRKLSLLPISDVKGSNYRDIMSSHLICVKNLWACSSFDKLRLDTNLYAAYLYIEDNLYIFPKLVWEITGWQFFLPIPRHWYVWLFNRIFFHTKE